MDILVVDDSRTILSMTTFVLEKEGYSVKSCLSAEDALRFLETEDVKLIITDINMPGMGGEEFINKVSDNPKYQDTVIIVNSTTIENDLSLPSVTQWMTKPLNPHKLTAMLKTLVL